MLSAGQGTGATSGNDNRINSLVSFGRSSLASFDRSKASASSTGATGSVQLAVSIGPLKRVGSPGNATRRRAITLPGSTKGEVTGCGQNPQDSGRDWFSRSRTMTRCCDCLSVGREKTAAVPFRVEDRGALIGRTVAAGVVTACATCAADLHRAYHSQVFKNRLILNGNLRGSPYFRAFDPKIAEPFPK